MFVHLQITVEYYGIINHKNIKIMEKNIYFTIAALVCSASVQAQLLHDPLLPEQKQHVSALVPRASAENTSVWLMNSVTQDLHFQQTSDGYDYSYDNTQTLSTERDSNGDITHQRTSNANAGDLPSYTDYSYIKIGGMWYLSEKVETDNDGKELSKTSNTYSKSENEITCEIRDFYCAQTGDPILTGHKYEELKKKHSDTSDETVVTYTLTNYMIEYEGKPLEETSKYWIYKNGKLNSYSVTTKEAHKPSPADPIMLIVRSYEYTDITWDEECTTEPENCVSSDWENWFNSDDNGMLSCNTRTLDQIEGDATSVVEYNIKLSRTVTSEGGFKKIISISDARPSYYNVREKVYTDKLGSYTYIQKHYQNVTGDVSDECLASTYTEDMKYSTEDDYVMCSKWIYGDGTRIVRDDAVRVVERDPLHGYITKKERDYSTKSYNTVSEEPTEITTYNFKWTYGDYHEYTPTAIAPVAADGDTPAHIYNLQGVSLGSQLDALPSGIYIVKKGTRAVKVKK